MTGVNTISVIWTGYRIAVLETTDVVEHNNEIVADYIPGMSNELY